MKAGLLCPGQGAQAVGMGADLAQASPAAQAVFQRADALLGFGLSSACFEGPAELLTRTDVAQPAIYTCSLAALAALEERLGSPLELTTAAGLSLGEYTALAAAGVFGFEDGLKLVRLRGQAMQAASEGRPSGMSSILGLGAEPLEALCAEIAAATGCICQVANLNSPGQVVVSGENPALDALEARVLEAGARRAVRLKVAGAFHSEVMRPAAEQLEAALARVEFRPPRCPVWPNATAAPEVEPAALRRQLAAQLTSPVLWERAFRDMAGRSRAPFLEPAPGRVLAGLARKIDPGSRVLALNHMAALEALAAAPQS